MVRWSPEHWNKWQPCLNRYNNYAVHLIAHHCLVFLCFADRIRIDFGYHASGELDILSCYVFHV